MGVCKNKIGLKIGRLTVVEKTTKRTKNGGVIWLCKCECGNYKEYCSYDLNSGKCKSCGCLSKEKLLLGRDNNYQDLTNMRFGNLIAIKRIEDKIYKNRNFVQWECICDCGKTINVIADNLRSGNSISCGYCNNNSHGNTKIAELLQKAGIKYEREKRFASCKNKRTLPFDFYVENRYLIEFDGIQHYSRESKFYTENIEYNDKIKDMWCKKHHISLIRIPYTHLDNLKLEDLLLNTSQFIIT